MKPEILKKCNVCESNNISCIDKNHNICKCRDCGYIFDNPRPTADEIQKFYSQFEKYDFWLAQEKERDLLWQRRLKMVKKCKKTGALLDVGGGTGQFLHFAKHYFNIHGTEVSESAIRIAKQKYNIELFRGEVENIDFGNLKFDMITLFHVLEHLPNPSLTIQRCEELLNKEGIIIIAVPNDISSIRALIKTIFTILKIGRWKNRGRFGLLKLTLNGSQDEIHLSHFTVPVLKTLLIKNGFTVIETGLDPYYLPYKYKRIIDDLYYLFCTIIQKILGVNFYDTIWLVARAK